MTEIEHIKALISSRKFYFPSVFFFVNVTCNIQITLVLFSNFNLILQLDCEAPRLARIHYFKPCDGWAGEQVMVCMYIKSFISFSSNSA